ncbi:hypothetical protein JCM6882_002176 [Rhodosporidiobolus microsporus]
MDRLPDELVLFVASHLDASRTRNDSAWEGQRGLAGLARSSRRFNKLLTPLLYLHPVLLRKDLNIDFDDSLAFQIPLPNLLPALELGLFASLTSIHLHYCSVAGPFLPALLGPKSSRRKHLQSLVVERPSFAWTSIDPDFCPQDISYLFSFLLEALRHLPTNAITSLDVYQSNKYQLGPWLLPSDLSTFSEHEAEDRCEYERALAIADTDFSAFCSITEYDLELDALDIEGFPHHSPFHSLHTLTLPLICTEHFHLTLYTSTFPSLRRLTFLGVPYIHEPHQSRRIFLTPRAIRTMRAAALPQGRLRQPDVEIYGFADPVLVQATLPDDFELEGTWGPVSAKEEEIHGRYEGVKLELLDCEQVKVALVED